MPDKVIGVFMGIIVLAALSVIISKRSNTAKVISTMLDGFVKAVKVAVSPVTK